MVKNQQRIEQIAGLILIGSIVIGCWLVLRPFTSAILWAAILSFATWPLYAALLRGCRGRRNSAAILMTLCLSLVLLVPFILIGFTFTDSIQSALDWFDKQKGTTIGPPPAWLEQIPIAGKDLKAYWETHAADASSALNWLKPWLQQAGVWLLKHSLDLAQGVFHLAMSMLMLFFFYRDGEEVVRLLREGFQRISGDYANELFTVIKGTVQGVVYGTIGTALAQAILAGIGFAIAGVPSPMQLALFTFFLSFIPVGPPIIWIGASVWLFLEGFPGWGIFMILWGGGVISMVDNFIKPYIISRGSRLSFITMLLGVLGGVITFGFIGVFLGPTLLAVGYSLVQTMLVRQRRHKADSGGKPAEQKP
ncbi:MAG: AI-2E family transporter [Phycisphaerae bacterium]|nr:AI-2E family transporter [Phycisphaerae bacterium]